MGGEKAEGRGSKEGRECRTGQEWWECREMTAGARRKGAAGVARPASGRRKVTRTLGRGSVTRVDDGRGETGPVEPLLTPSQSSGVEVNVISHKRQRYAVWYGGSLMASTVSSSLEFESHESPKPHLLQLSHPFFREDQVEVIGMYAMDFADTSVPTQPEFYNVSHSRVDYQEYGPSLVRRFSVFGSAV